MRALLLLSRQDRHGGRGRRLSQGTEEKSEAPAAADHIRRFEGLVDPLLHVVQMGLAGGVQLGVLERLGLGLVLFQGRREVALRLRRDVLKLADVVLDDNLPVLVPLRVLV